MNDLQNTYNSLFKYLRKEMLPNEADAFLADAKKDDDLLKELDTFRAAKALFVEDELVDFKAEAKKYVNANNGPSGFSKLMLSIAAILILGTTAYFITQNISNGDEKINDSGVYDTAPLNVVNADALSNNEGQEKVIEVHETNIKNRNIIETDTVHNTSQAISSSKSNLPEKEEIEAVVIRKEAERDENIPEGIVTIKNSKTATSIAANISKEHVFTETESEADADIEEEGFTIDNEEEVIVDLCAFNIASTYEPNAGDDFVLMELSYFAGELVIYNQYMHEVYKTNFNEQEEVVWNGRSYSGDYVVMGVYKIVISYHDGNKCIKDLTILER